MKKRNLTTLLLLLFLLTYFSTTLSAQIVRGVVKVEKSNGKVEPMPYASVYWLEGERVLESDDKGEFSFDRSRSKGAISLVATFVGHTQDTVIINGGELYAELLIKEGSQLEAARLVTSRQANYISKTTAVRTEVITAAGLCKMACCNLAESFENSASVTVGYSDAITGARQIRLLGLSGIYNQMLDENRPVMRGISAPFGLSYVPGQWLESIQIAKGPASVINGPEAISGQINLEHRKPTAEQPLFVNLFLSDVLRSEVNLASSLQLNNRWSTVTLAHFSHDPGNHDGNDDGFRDEPNATQFGLSNRWLYMDESGVQVRFGFKALKDERTGGQLSFDKSVPRSTDSWGTNIKNEGISGYLKVGVPLNEDNSQNIATVIDYSYYTFDSHFGLKEYNATQNSLFLNLIYQNEFDEKSRLSFGGNIFYDDIDEHLKDYYIGSFNSLYPGRKEGLYGLFGEYSFNDDEKFTLVAGVRGDYNSIYGWKVAPRLNIKYSFHDNLIFRALGGRGYRTPNVIADNLGILSTSRKVEGWQGLKAEDAWTVGANLTAYFPLGEEEASISLDYFRSDFVDQVVVDQEFDLGKISIYNLDGRSYTNTYQVDFNLEPIERFTMMATFRYTDAKITLAGQGLVDKPLTSKYKGVLNLQYATRMNIWTFDFTAQLNGPSRVPLFTGFDEYSPVHGIFFAQVTKKFKDVEIYVGGENLTNYRQERAIISADDPYSPEFNASMIWGPLMGRKFYIGLRYTLWK